MAFHLHVLPLPVDNTLLPTMLSLSHALTRMHEHTAKRACTHTEGWSRHTHTLTPLPLSLQGSQLTHKLCFIHNQPVLCSPPPQPQPGRVGFLPSLLWQGENKGPMDLKTLPGRTRGVQNKDQKKKKNWGYLNLCTRQPGAIFKLDLSPPSEGILLSLSFSFSLSFFLCLSGCCTTHINYSSLVSPFPGKTNHRWSLC